MYKEAIIRKLAEACLNFDPEAAKKAAYEAIERDVDAVEAIEKGLASGIRELGERFGRGETFLFELVRGAEAMKEAAEILQTRIPAEREIQTLGTIVIGTVKGDIHDIGKNIAAVLLRANGFKIYDLGTDVPTDVFIEKVRKLRPNIIGLSALMITTLDSQKEVIDALKHAGLRQKVKVIVGGAPVNAEWCEEAGADGYADSAIEGVNIAKKLVKRI